MHEIFGDAAGKPGIMISTILILLIVFTVFFARSYHNIHKKYALNIDPVEHIQKLYFSGCKIDR